MEVRQPTNKEDAVTVMISQSFEAISDLAHNAGFTAVPFGAGWGYASNGTRWVGQTFTRGHREIGVFADADGSDRRNPSHRRRQGRTPGTGPGRRCPAARLAAAVPGQG